MSRFAKISEDAFLRYSELTGEEWRLYCTICFYTFWDSGFCRKNLRQIAQIHKLSYTHTTERYKQLKKLKWCEDTKNGIRPLMGLNVPVFGTLENEVFRKPEHSSSENRNIDVPETGTNKDEMFPKPEHTYKEYIEPFKDENFIDNNTTENSDVVVKKTNGHKSQFSFQECLRYVELCQSEGQEVKNRYGLATHLLETGTSDALILAKLYPPPSEQPPQSQTEKERANALQILRDVQAMGDDISELEKYYTPEMWNWLKTELAKVEYNN